MTANTTTTSRPHFVSWRDVPAGIYATATQLKTMDLPRQPGPPAACGEQHYVTLHRSCAVGGSRAADCAAPTRSVTSARRPRG
ncbi:hypothetical protein [Streptomyces sp. NBC_01618]|uniref:hypothetical protein n=1 Tax=Streptomyces sp. NBC_01618 TaxID=2975900 RepID=UPI003864218F|nr:hypothetical protein OH735_00865 [Streptomyces sp. NBC_01618]